MTDFHKVWIEQCEAAEGIREQFGVADAARYAVQAGLVPDPAKLFNLEFEEGELDEHEVQNDADRILVIENAKRLLLG